MKYVTYKDKLKDPRWQKKRLKVLEYANWRCQLCGDNSQELHVHHPRYVKGKLPWQYKDGELTALCYWCHDVFHEVMRRSDNGIKIFYEEPKLEKKDIPLDADSASVRFEQMRQMLQEIELK
jgi:5-methylcytosine-specific restriction endonuclease McrA